VKKNIFYFRVLWRLFCNLLSTIGVSRDPNVLNVRSTLKTRKITVTIKISINIRKSVRIYFGVNFDNGCYQVSIMNNTNIWKPNQYNAWTAATHKNYIFGNTYII